MHSAFLLLTLTCATGQEPVAAPLAAPSPVIATAPAGCGCGGDVWTPDYSGHRHRRFGGRLGFLHRRHVSTDCGCAAPDGPPAMIAPSSIPAAPTIIPGTTSLPDASYRPLPTTTAAPLAPLVPMMPGEPPLPGAN